MRILQINAVYGVGSTGVIVRDIHELCLEKGIESYVAYSTSNILPGEIKNGYKIGNKLDKKLHALLCRINGKQAYFSRGSTKKLIKHIKEIKPDARPLKKARHSFPFGDITVEIDGKTLAECVKSVKEALEKYAK